MNIAVVGTGYVGLVSAACFAQGGHRVTCVDIDDAKIATLCRGEMPIYEPELEKLVTDGRRRKRLYFTSDPAAAQDHDVHGARNGTWPRASGIAERRRLRSSVCLRSVTYSNG